MSLYEQHLQTIQGDINTGGAPIYTGNPTIIMRDVATPLPIELATAQARLAMLRLDHVPPITDLPSNSFMPWPRNPLFVGREQELLTLAAAVKGNQSITAIGPIAAATGLGGIGKTQLAAAFVHHYGAYFLGGVYWFSFADDANIPAEIARCASTMPDLPLGVTQLSLDEQVRAIRHAWQSPLPRLLVFDNCEEPALLQQWRPITGGCRLLLTSRRTQWDAAFAIHILPLSVLPRAESVTLLAQFAAAPSARQTAWSPATLSAIAAELGDLPLALHLAGSFLRASRYDVTPATYLEQLRQPDLLHHISLQHGETSPTGHELHIVRTFDLSYTQLRPSAPHDLFALQVLAAACFAPGQPIPRALLRNSILTTSQESHTFAAGVNRLTALGLVNEADDGDLLLHRLLARFIHDRMPETVAAAQPNVETTILATAKSINNRGDPRPLLTWQPHLRHITHQAQSRHDRTAASLCNHLGFHLDMLGDYEAAYRYHEWALTIHKARVGEHHPDTARSLNKLGSLLYALGNYPSAKVYLNQALLIAEQILGEQHVDTATILNDLGLLAQATADYASARRYYEWAMGIYETQVGEQHAYLAVLLNNLGSLFRAMGDYSMARTYYQRALSIHEVIYGEQHPATATSLNNLGVLLNTMGDYTAAHNYHQRALAIRQTVLGNQHPDTARSLNNLAATLHAIGDLAGAHTYYTQALAIRMAAYGEHHPDTARSLSNLGAILQGMGDYTAAQTYYERALAILMLRVGNQHPATASCLVRLGDLLSSMDNDETALLYYERALATYRTLFGEEHPSTSRAHAAQQASFRKVAARALPPSSPASPPLPPVA